VIFLSNPHSISPLAHVNMSAMTNKHSNAKPINDSLWQPRYWPTWLAVAMLRIIAALPFSAKLFAGKFFGLLALYTAKSRRHVTETNIRLCFPELTADQQQQLVKDIFIQNGIGFFEIAWSWWAKPKAYQGRYTLENLHLLEQARQHGKGVLLVGAHFVHLDLAGALLGQTIPIGTIYRINNNPVLEQVITKGRKRSFTDVIDRLETRKIIKRLREGGMLWYAPDQDMNHKQSVFAPFFGVQASTITATSRLAKLGNANVLGVFHYRDPKTHQYRIVFKSLEANFPTGNDIDDASSVNRMIEQAIREEPSQYMWVHRRFKTRPPGEAGIY